jgi:hypothetical protein
VSLPDKVRSWLMLVALVVGGLVAAVKVVLWADELLEAIEANTAATMTNTGAIMDHHPEFRPDGVMGVDKAEEGETP